MVFDERKTFTFVSEALPGDTFSVLEFQGTEGVSRLYEFHITLVSRETAIKLKDVLEQPAVLTLLREGREGLPFHGIVAQFEQLHEAKDYVYYRAVLVPRLWQSSLYHENQLFLDKSVPEVIEEILEQAGLTADDFELKLTGDYPPWEYICQYNESDFNFISRWMEREGIYYYFEQTDEAEKLIITDTATRHEDLKEEQIFSYSPPTALIPGKDEVIQSLLCRQKTLPKKVILKDYNYRKPSLEIRGEAEVDPNGRGSVYIYGEHFKEPEAGNGLAKIRAQELSCRETVFHGESTVPFFRPGFLFELQDHYRVDFNARYLLLEVEHRGSQVFAEVSGLSRDGNRDQEAPAYTNTFSCITEKIQFRPERSTHKPRFYGTLNAQIDAAGDGQYAEIDDQGRYKVKLPFDQADAEGGKASRWIRMAQPYAGGGFGMHFPLHKGTEVLLTFVDGDPDRPIIAGSVPNPETMSPITSESHTKSMVRTAASNEIMMEDEAGSEMIRISSPFSNSKIFMGAKASTDGIRATTDGHGIFHAKKGIYLNAWPTDYFSTGDASKYINAGVSAVNTIGAAAAAAGAGKLASVPAIMGVLSAVANIVAPGIVLSSPSGISAITPSTFTAVGMAGVGLFTPAVADIVGVTSASLMSGGGINIYTVAGGIRCVAGNGDIKINAKSDDIRLIAKKNVSIEAQTNNVALQAKKEVDIVAEEEDASLSTMKTDVIITGKKNIKEIAQDENIELTGKKKVLITAEEERLQLMAVNADILLEGETKIVLKCGDSSIAMEKGGKIVITGKDVEVDGGSGPINIHGGKIDLN